MDDTPQETYYLAIEGTHLLEGTVPPLKLGEEHDLAVCGIFHQMTASFTRETRVSRLGNSLYRIRGKVWTKSDRAWILRAGIPILCHGDLPSCFAPRKWIEGVFTLTLDGQDMCDKFTDSIEPAELVRPWKVLTIYRDNTFWDAIRSEGESPVPLSGQVIKALQYFERLGNETHWSRLKELPTDCQPTDHFLVVLERIADARDALE